MFCNRRGLASGLTTLQGASERLEAIPREKRRRIVALHTYLGKTTVTNDGPRVEGSTSAAGCATPVAEWSSRRVPFLMIKAMHENENTSASILVKRSKWMLFFLSSVQSSDAWTADEFDRRFRTPVCIFQRFPLTLSGSFYGRSGRRMRRMLGIVQRPLPPRVTA